MTRKRFWVWFGPIVLGNLVGQLLDVTLLDYVFKPMLVPALLLYLYLNTRNGVSASIRLVVAGLSFSWLGDVILLFSAQSELFFAAGLGAFLIAHLFYIAAYIHTVRGAPGEAFFRRRPGGYSLSCSCSPACTGYCTRRWVRCKFQCSSTRRPSC